MDEPVVYRALLSENLKTNGVNVNIELQGEPDTEGKLTAVAAHALADALETQYPHL
jgi:uncharacterized protein